MKHRKWSFSRIELNCKEGMKMYVDGARVITTVNIQKIQIDYGATLIQRNSRKTKRRKKGLGHLYRRQQTETLST